MTDTALNVMGKYYTIFGNKLMFPMFSKEYRYTLHRKFVYCL